MKCSVVIPYKSRRVQLENTLQRLQHQSLSEEEYQVILVEDGSADFSKETLEQQYHFGHLVYLNTGEVSIGSARARNLGIQYAVGDIIVFLDCDMLVTADFLENHIRFHQSLPAGTKALQCGLRKMLTSSYSKNLPQSFDDLVPERDFNFEARHYIFQLYSENLSNYVSGWFYAFSCNLSVEKSVLEQFGGFDENFVGWGLEDNELGYRLFLNGVVPMFNPAIEAYHQYHGPEVSQEKINGPTTNLDYFCHKYNDVPTTLFKAMCLYQRTFADELDSISQALFVTRTHQFFSAFEKSLRLYFPSSGNFDAKVTLNQPAMDDIDDLLRLRPHTQCTVICPMEDVDTVIGCQLHGRRDQLLLHCV
jgi:GT2 family glycosyltransferase